MTDPVLMKRDCQIAEVMERTSQRSLFLTQQELWRKHPHDWNTDMKGHSLLRKDTQRKRKEVSKPRTCSERNYKQIDLSKTSVPKESQRKQKTVAVHSCFALPDQEDNVDGAFFP